MMRVFARTRSTWLTLSVLLVGMTMLGAAEAKPQASEAEKMKTAKVQAEKAQRVNEERQQRWDRKMKAVSGSICSGC